MSRKMRAAIRTGRTLWRVYRHRRMDHSLIVDPGAVTCQTCSRVTWDGTR